MGPACKVGQVQMECLRMKDRIFSNIYPAGKAKHKEGKG